MSVAHSLLGMTKMVLVSCVVYVYPPLCHGTILIFLQLVYADIDVKKPAVSSRSRPPPPPQGFATEQDANGPVIYSSVQLL